MGRTVVLTKESLLGMYDRQKALCKEGESLRIVAHEQKKDEKHFDLFVFESTPDDIDMFTLVKLASESSSNIKNDLIDLVLDKEELIEFCLGVDLVIIAVKKADGTSSDMEYLAKERK